MLAKWKGDARTQAHLAPRGISWEFIPPHAPHQGGSWERLVGIVKKTILSLTHGELEYERYRTIVLIAMGIVNRRPLTRVSSDSGDATPLTPAHFLCPASLVTPVPSSDVLPAEPLSGSALRRSKDSLRPIVDLLWKRWYNEYTAALQQRTKWLSHQRNLEKGDLVLVIDELHPRETWPLGLITATIPSDDGLVRCEGFLTSANDES